jgi:hypothetical protein
MVTLTIFGTQVKINPVILVNLAVLWAAPTWIGLSQHPDRGFWTGLLIGFIAMILLIIADFGHAIAHIFSARYAKAPMDKILISAGMPRTLYSNDDVSPAAHRMRAIGGPIFSALGLLLSLGIYGLASSGSGARELAAWSTIGHGLIFVGSILPLPIVDGGTILKWTLVERGKTEAEADDILRRVGRLVGVVVVAIGAGLLIAQMWIVGLIVLIAGVIILYVA